MVATARTFNRQALKPLLDYLDNLTARADKDLLEERMRACRFTLDDVAEFVRFSEDHYRRNLICEGPHYHMLALCWRSGQRSPIHNHAQSVCGVRVLTGTATETVFEHMAGGVKALYSSDLNCGEVIASQDSDTHQVSNLQPEGVDLVTMHIYSPPLLKMDTFSITDNAASTYCPVFDEHEDGSGI